MMRAHLQVLLSCILFAACTAVRDVQPAELAAPHAPTQVRAKLSDGTVLVFDTASVRGDTLVGAVAGQQTHVLLSDVAVLQEREPSGSRTALAISAGALVAIGSLYLLEIRKSGVDTAAVCAAQCNALMSGQPYSIPNYCFCS